MSPEFSTESYPAFARIGLRENPGKNLNQVTCPDRDSNLVHLVSRPDALTVTPQVCGHQQPEPQSEFSLLLMTSQRKEPALSLQEIQDIVSSPVGRSIRSRVRFPPLIAVMFMVDQLKGHRNRTKEETSEVRTFCGVWHMGAETWTKRRSQEKRIEAFEMWIWRRMERVKWTDRIRNEAVLERVREERMMLKLIRKRKGPLAKKKLKDALEGMVNVRRVRGRRRHQMINDIRIYGSYAETKRKVENRKDRRMLDLPFGRKAHAGHEGNELADQLAKEAARSEDIPESYSKTPKSAVKSEAHLALIVNVTSLNLCFVNRFYPPGFYLADFSVLLDRGEWSCGRNVNYRDAVLERRSSSATAPGCRIPMALVE
ncbi:hypothetical protein ANN_24401 [Periplaneta americana]|uniref:RNase H type-1 domain-containing protein n=1 Tax=Periplaneta americana TaxID=6978 RepID=A0ABQ8S319_PERAM|nr:hypothetical protein ANN_24401 [Periplaneta americana]